MNHSSNFNFSFKNTLRYTHSSLKFNGNDKLNMDYSILLKTASNKFNKTRSLSILPEINKKNPEKNSFISLIPDLNVAFDIFKKRKYQKLSYDIQKICNNDIE